MTVLRSEPNLGTTFLFQVEDQPEKLNSELAELESEKASENEIKADILKGTRVLVIDDAPDNQQLIWRYLTKYGASVEAAENGLIGYRKALSNEYDIVLMDIQMPEMDGYTATYKLRSAGYRKPIVALTAHAMSEVRQKCLNVGCTAHLPKPINQRNLIDSVARLTGKL